jgi:nitrogen fixation protein NifU and related proteins
MSIYQEIIMNHYHHPHNYGALPQPDADVNIVNTSCGDSIRVTVTSDGTTIRDVAFEGHGCAISTAAASLLTDHIKGMSFDAVRKLTTHDVLTLLGISLTPGRLKCALLPLEGIHRAINTLEK